MRQLRIAGRSPCREEVDEDGLAGCRNLGQRDRLPAHRRHGEVRRPLADVVADRNVRRRRWRGGRRRCRAGPWCCRWGWRRRLCRGWDCRRGRRCRRRWARGRGRSCRSRRRRSCCGRGRGRWRRLARRWRLRRDGFHGSRGRLGGGGGSLQLRGSPWTAQGVQPLRPLALALEAAVLAEHDDAVRVDADGCGLLRHAVVGQGAADRFREGPIKAVPFGPSRDFVG